MNRTRQALLALSSTSLVLAACSSGGGDPAPAEQGALTISITDAASDELSSFQVELTAIQLTRPDGALVGVLPAAVDVDLMTLTETSQVLNILNVPAGAYQAATVTIDFTDASCYLIDETTPATILDSDGLALTGEHTFPIDVGNMLVALANRHRILELDFDLDQSVIVDATENEVRMEPSIMMRVDRTDPKDLVLFGTLVSVDEPASTFAFELRGHGGQLLATVTANVDASTVFQIDGDGSVGATGLTALAAQSAGTWIQCYGAIHPLQARIDVSYVEAGMGTYNGGSDIVEGYIVSRIGGAGADPQLIVLGHSNDVDHNSFQFNTEFTVAASLANTNVVRRGYLQAFDTDDLNVGQRVRVFGTLAGTVMTADGTDSVIRMQPTRVLGFATGPVASSELTVDVTWIGIRTADRFTWADGGTTPTDPDALVAAVAGLGNGLGIEEETAVIVHGFFSAVDDDDADFTATTLINRDLAPSLMAIRDRIGGLTLTPTVTTDRIELAWSGTPWLFETAVIDRGFVGASPLPQDPVPAVVSADGPTLFALHNRDTGAFAIHLQFADFTDALAVELGTGAKIFNFGAVGAYEAASNTISAGLVTVTID